MVRAISLRRRFSGPRIAEEVCWVTTDVTHEVFGVVDGGRRQFWKLPGGAAMGTFMGEDDRRPGMSERESVGPVVGSVAGFAAHPRNRALRRGSKFECRLRGSERRDEKKMRTQAPNRLPVMAF